MRLARRARSDDGVAPVGVFHNGRRSGPGAGSSGGCFCKRLAVVGLLFTVQ